MPSETTFLGLIKPFGSEFYDVEVGNNNFSAIDEEFRKLFESDVALDMKWLTDEKSGLITERINKAIKDLSGIQIDGDTLSNTIEKIKDASEALESEVEKKLDKSVWDASFVVDHTKTHDNLDASIRNLNKILFGSDAQPEEGVESGTGTISELKNVDQDIKNSIGSLDTLGTTNKDSIVKSINELITNYIGKPMNINMTPRPANVVAGMNRLITDVNNLKLASGDSSDIIEEINLAIAKYTQSKCIISYQGTTPVTVSDITTSSCTVSVNPMKLWFLGRSFNTSTSNTTLTVSTGYIGFVYNSSGPYITSRSNTSYPDFIPLLKKDGTTITLLWNSYYIGTNGGLYSSITDNIDELVKNSNEDISDIKSLTEDKQNEWVATATSSDGKAYTATLYPTPSRLYKGMVITIIPNTDCTSMFPTLNVNGLGSKNIYRNNSSNVTSSEFMMPTADIEFMNIRAGYPIRLMYNGTYWIMIDYTKPNWNDIYDRPSKFTPISHASDTTDYGIGNLISYGHVKLIDNATDDIAAVLTASEGVAATPSSVKKALETKLDYSETANSFLSALSYEGGMSFKLNAQLNLTTAVLKNIISCDIRSDGATINGSSILSYIINTPFPAELHTSGTNTVCGFVSLLEVLEDLEYLKTRVSDLESKI